MADLHYYVSQQNGNDLNDGLTPATAWKSLTKAATTIPTPDASTDNIYCHIGPGTYYEKFVPTNSGASATKKIIYQGDPYCQWLINDTPGRVRISGCDANDKPTAGKVLDWTGKTNLELRDVEVDGSSNDYACYKIETCRNVKAISYNGFGSCDCYNCTAIAANYGFANDASPDKYIYNCIALAAVRGFTSIGGGVHVYCYNCVAVGGSYGFYADSGFTYLHFCTAVGSRMGFYRNYTMCAYGCAAIACNLAYQSVDAVYNSLSIASTTELNGSSAYNFKGVYGNAAGAALPHTSFDISRLIPPVLDAGAFIRTGYIHNPNCSTAATMNLSVERYYAFTPPEAGRSIGAYIWVQTAPVNGTITVALQKYVDAAWVTQKSKTLSAEYITAGWNYFPWDTGSGDDQLTAVASTWRFAISADTNAAVTILYGNNTTTPSVMGSYIPADQNKIVDFEGKVRAYGEPTVGAWDIPSIVLDKTVFQTTPPSIKFTGHGEKILKLPVKKNQLVTVSYQVQHNGAAAGKEPQIRLQHPLITTQVATHSAGALVWELLSVSVTPTFDGVIDVVLASRDPSAVVYFSDPSVT